MLTFFIRMAFIVILIISTILLFGVRAHTLGSELPNDHFHGTTKMVQQVQVKSKEEISFDHRRETWLSALEWCESKGFNEAINPQDRDGTPSYYAYQFKPETFLLYGIKYFLIPSSTTKIELKELMKNYKLMRNIVRHMIDDKSVDWYQQFPDCVRLKVGLPPVK